MNRIKLGTLADLADLPEHAQEQTNPTCHDTTHGGKPSNHWMTQLQQGHASCLPPPESKATLEELEANFVEPRVSLFLPVHYQSRYAYPVLIWLHPPGGSEKHLETVMPQISERNFVGVSIAGSQPISAGEPHEATGFDWQPTADATERLVNQIAFLLQSLSRRFHIHSSRVFLAGLGSGGTMAYRAAFMRPEWFAGVASLNGGLPAGEQPLFNWRNCRSVPVFWAHGRRSRRFPEARLCHQLRLLHVAGFDVTLRQYPAVDELPGQVFGDLNRWMMGELAKMGTNVVV